MSIYEQQKRSLDDSVEGVADPDLVCHKCGKTAEALKECEHCGWNVRLCTECFFSAEHWGEYIKIHREE